MTSFFYNHATSTGTSHASGLVDDQRSLVISAAIASRRPPSPRARILLPSRLHAYSNLRASLKHLKPDTLHARVHTPDPREVCLAPPRISPLCCLRRRSKYKVAPTYVRRPFFRRYTTAELPSSGGGSSASGGGGSSSSGGGCIGVARGEAAHLLNPMATSFS